TISRERAVADPFRERDAIPDKRSTFRNLDLKDTWQGHVPDCRRGSARSGGASALTMPLRVRRATKKEGDQRHPSSVDDSITSSTQISSHRSQFLSLAGLLQNAAPDAVDGPL